MKRLLLTTLLMTALASARADVATKTYPNGLLWIHRPVTHNQIAAIRLFMPGGTATDPLDKAGMTGLMTSVMAKGTRGRSALAFAEAVENLGASLGASADEDYWELSGQVTVDRFPALFSLFEEDLFQPSFPEDEVVRERQAHLNAIRANREHIFHVAYERLRKELFPGHPYGRPEDGTEKSVGSLTRQDIVDCHRRHLQAKGAVLVTVANVSQKELTALVDGLASHWPAASAASSPVGPAVYPAGPVKAEEAHSFEQSFVMIAYPAPGPADPDYAALKVLNAWLGAGMSSPLFMKVREEGGLAYEVASFYPTQKEGSSFIAYAGMDPANLDLAQRKAQEVLADALKNPPSAEDVESAKRYILGHFAMDHQTNARMAWYLGFYRMMGLGPDFDQKYPDMIRAVTAADVQRAAKKVLGRPPVVTRIRSAKKK
jgi:zinc protease